MQNFNLDYILKMGTPPTKFWGSYSQYTKSNDTQEVEIGHLVDNPETSVQAGDLKFGFTVTKGLNESIVQVTPIVGSDGTKGRVQTPLEKVGFTIPTAESTCEGELRLTPSYKRRKDQETNQCQVSKEILSETIDEEAQMISLEVHKAMEEKYKAEQEAIQLKLQQEKLQREQEELARKQAEEFLVKEQQ